MLEFAEALSRHGFLQNALATGLLSSVSCGVVGTYVVTRRITYVAGGISHCVLGGMGAARYLQSVHGLSWFHPMYGAIASALAAALIIAMVSLKAKQREDTVIGAVWAVGMAAGIVFISKTPGFGEDLMGYLFGNILMVSGRDLWMIAGLDVLVVATGLIFYNQLQAVCFDEEYARLRGLNVEFYYVLLLSMTALTVVLLSTMVGIVMVIAMLTLPVAAAGLFSRSLWQMMAISACLSGLYSVLGLAVSFGPDLPVGAVTILLSGAGYILALSGKAAVARLGIFERLKPVE